MCQLKTHLSTDEVVSVTKFYAHICFNIVSLHCGSVVKYNQAVVLIPHSSKKNRVGILTTVKMLKLACKQMSVII